MEKLCTKGKSLALLKKGEILGKNLAKALYEEGGKRIVDALIEEGIIKYRYGISNWCGPWRC